MSRGGVTTSRCRSETVNPPGCIPGGFTHFWACLKGRAVHLTAPAANATVHAGLAVGYSRNRDGGPGCPEGWIAGRAVRPVRGPVSLPAPAAHPPAIGSRATAHGQTVRGQRVHGRRFAAVGSRATAHGQRVHGQTVRGQTVHRQSFRQNMTFPFLCVRIRKSGSCEALSLTHNLCFTGCKVASLASWPWDWPRRNGRPRGDPVGGTRKWAVCAV
jgi:hypothetical protein